MIQLCVEGNHIPHPRVIKIPHPYWWYPASNLNAFYTLVNYSNPFLFPDRYIFGPLVGYPHGSGGGAQNPAGGHLWVTPDDKT